MKLLYLVLGLISLSLGAIGALIPVLPTVPFLLLASFFFAKSSKRLNDWLKSTKLYKKHLEGFSEHRSMTLRTKLIILIPVSCMLLIALYFSKPLVARIIILIALALKYYFFLFKIKTIKKDDKHAVGEMVTNQIRPEE